MALPRYPATVRARIMAEAARMIEADGEPGRGLEYAMRAAVAFHELHRAKAGRKKSRKIVQKDLQARFHGVD